MKKLVSTAEGDAETPAQAEVPTPEQQLAPPVGPNPNEGGRYLRNPATGELTKVED